MNRTWSGIVIAATGGFFLLVAVFQDIATPNAVIWEPAEIAAVEGERAVGLVLRDAKDGVLFGSSGFSIYRSEGDRGFLKVHSARPPLGPAWIAYSRTFRRWLGLLDVIDVLPLSQTAVLVLVGGEIHRIDLGSGKTEIVHRLRYHGLGAWRGGTPVGMTADGAGRIYFGEQATRSLADGESIALFRSDDEGRSFEVVQDFPADSVRAVHSVQWDIYGQALWVSTGDEDGRSRIGYSKDFGETFVWIGQGSQDFRVVNMTFSKDHVDWLSDVNETSSRVFRWRRDRGEIQTSPKSLPGNGRDLEGIGDGFSLGATALEVASLWLVGPELGIENIMTWPLAETGGGGFEKVNLAGQVVEGDEWLYLSPLRTEKKQPAVYRFTRRAAFRAAGMDRPPQRHLSSRDDPTQP